MCSSRKETTVGHVQGQREVVPNMTRPFVKLLKWQKMAVTLYPEELTTSLFL